MDTVRIGLIGLGDWPREAYVPTLQTIDEAQVVAVAARTEATHDYAREQFGEAITCYTDYNDLLADDAVDAVMLALPNPLHADATIAAAQSGKHLFFEPPIALHAMKAAEVLEALREAEGVVQIDHELRYVPVLQRALQMLEDGAIGDVRMAKMRLWCDWHYEGSEWLEEIQGQGFFLWLGCWYLDVLDAVFGYRPEKAWVTGGYDRSGDIMDYGCATLTYAGDRVGQLEFSLICPEGQETSLAILGSAGEIHADLWHGHLHWLQEAEDWQETEVPPAEPVYGFAGMRASINSFTRAILRGQPVRADIEVIKRVHEMAFTCHRSEKEKLCLTVKPLD